MGCGGEVVGAPVHGKGGACEALLHREFVISVTLVAWRRERKQLRNAKFLFNPMRAGEILFLGR